MRKNGFTALELLIVMTIAGLVTAAGAPSFFKFIEHQRVVSGAQMIVGDAWLARSRAVTRAESWELRFRRDTQAYEVWRVFDPTSVAGPKLIKRVSLPVNVWVESTTMPRITFAPDGTASMTGEVTVGNRKTDRLTVGITQFIGRAVIK